MAKKRNDPSYIKIVAVLIYLFGVPVSYGYFATADWTQTPDPAVQTLLAAPMSLFWTALIPLRLSYVAWEGA